LFLIVGLGNPGMQYALTRHNVGFWVIDVLAGRAGVNLEKECCRSLVAQVMLAGKRVVLAKPLTYMNRSGRAVRDLLQFYALQPEKLLVVYDDLDLPPGRLRLRSKGGSGGHRGMSSVLTFVGNDQFARLRLGIGRPAEGAENGVDYVLAPFTADQEKSILKTVELAADAAETFLARGLAAAMNRYNAQFVENDENEGSG
jgi:PTH1 family peptidyl-tRNA hydrolase